MKQETELHMPEHPAKYTEKFIPIFAEILNGHKCKNVLDPFAGVGKIGKIRSFGFTGMIYANELEPEWITNNLYGCDVITTMDAEQLMYGKDTFDAICTSPTYGNRMADHHNAMDGSKRMTYTHCLGHSLHPGNTGMMQWGTEYRRKHASIYRHIIPMLRPGGIFILNISNHIRKGQEIDVCSFHVQELLRNGMTLTDTIEIQTPRMRRGQNGKSRVATERIYTLTKLY